MWLTLLEQLHLLMLCLHVSADNVMNSLCLFTWCMLSMMRVVGVILLIFGGRIVLVLVCSLTVCGSVCVRHSSLHAI